MSNQPWLVAVEDDLKGEDGIPLFVSDDPARPRDEGDNWTARSMPSWNADGTEVGVLGGQRHRTVAAGRRQGEYTTSVGTADDKTTPALSSALPTLTSNTPQQVEPFQPGRTGCRGGSAGGHPDHPGQRSHRVRSVTYTDYVNVDGMIRTAPSRPTRAPLRTPSTTSPTSR